MPENCWIYYHFKKYYYHFNQVFQFLSLFGQFDTEKLQNPHVK